MKIDKLKASFLLAYTWSKRKISHLVVREGIDDDALAHGVLRLRSTQ